MLFLATSKVILASSVGQVFKIMFGGSAEGISFLSVLLELLAISCSGVYSYASGFPFSAYGEAVFLAVQVR
jgi:mannose-P-dolichol utilization defect protein 1